jgi:hypothetical protein
LLVQGIAWARKENRRAAVVPGKRSAFRGVERYIYFLGEKSSAEAKSQEIQAKRISFFENRSNEVMKGEFANVEVRCDCCLDSPWHKIDAGDDAPKRFNVIIKVPIGSTNKYELDKKTRLLKLDRVLYSAVYYPANYGFIPQTLVNDGDSLVRSTW